MKKIISLILALAALICFVSCAYIEEDQGLSDIVEDIVGNVTGGEYNVHALYDYGFHMTDKASLLYDHSSPFFDIPEEHGAVIGGDCFTVKYTGELLIQETYPSSVVFYGGEITEVSSQKAEVVRVLYTPSDDMKGFALLSEDGSTEELPLESVPSAYITDAAEGVFENLPTEGEPLTLYASYCPDHGVTEDGAYKILGLFSENPR